MWRLCSRVLTLKDVELGVYSRSESLSLWMRSIALKVMGGVFDGLQLG